MKIRTDKIFVLFDSHCDECEKQIPREQDKDGYIRISIAEIIQTGAPMCCNCGAIAADYEYVKIVLART